ncbi:unnamed protein product [Clavelina lepadiformis]|uniref:Mitochondrial import receptor subunit TOM22 homolog n=1 Tax=Clavelina lepadiformis TaxID=159417 RepID=A0ABP0G051_CLALP
MFPERVRNATSKTASYTSTGCAKFYRFIRSAMWIGASSFVILAVPIVFEQERYNMEQQQQQHQRQLLLGPNAAVSNTPNSMGMVPPPPPQ